MEDLHVGEALFSHRSSITPPPPYSVDVALAPEDEVVWQVRKIDIVDLGSCAAKCDACLDIDDGVAMARPVETEREIGKLEGKFGEERTPTETENREAKEDPWALSDFKHTDIPFNELTCCGKVKHIFVNWLFKPVLIIGLLYFFICSLDLMSSAFRLLGGKEAGEVFAQNDLLNNPICGLMIGILATVLVQSSSTSTSIVVSVVAAGILPVRPAIYIIMGANIGTSVTNTIVSMAQSANRAEFRRAFGAATVHDMFNWLSVICLLPVEACTGYLYHLTSLIVSSFNIEANKGVKVELLKVLTKPFSKKIIQIDSKKIAKIATGQLVASDESLLKVCKEVVPEVTETAEALLSNTTGSPPWSEATNTTTSGHVTGMVEVGVEKCHFIFSDTGLSDRAIGGILLVVALVMLCGCLIMMVKTLNSVLKGRMAGIIRRTINADFPGPFSFLTGYFAIIVGAGITFLVQSSSVFTSAMTPLVGVGVVTLERMYPLTLGSNIGTTATGLLAAMASSGDKLENSIQIALCHLFFNISGVLLWYPIPTMRKVPILLAKKLGNTTAEYRWFAIMYLILMFFILPCTVFGLSLISIWCLVAVGIPVGLVAVFVVVVNVLQSKKPTVLPHKLQTWECLPLWMRSLSPMDRIISKLLSTGKRCACKTSSQAALNTSGQPLVHSIAPFPVKAQYDIVNHCTIAMCATDSSSNDSERLGAV